MFQTFVQGCDVMQIVYELQNKQIRFLFVNKLKTLIHLLYVKFIQSCYFMMTSD